MRSPSRLGILKAALLLCLLPALAQESTPTSGPAIPMRDEGHHHLIFSNSFVNVFFVEIPPHESTLPHHHDLPYISVQPGGADAAPAPPGPLRIGFSAGNFSHAVTNSGDVANRNIAIELLRPQGTVRDRCAAILPGRTPAVCQDQPLAAAHPVKRTPLLETDELLAESWEFAPGAAFAPADQGRDILVAGLTDLQVTGQEGLDSANALRGGVLWIHAHSGAVFKSGPNRGGHCIAITFKDSAPAR